MQLTHMILFLLTVFLMSIVHINGRCKMEDSACEFSLEIKPWKTMRHFSQKKVFISDTDKKLYFVGTNETVSDEDIVLADGYAKGRAIHTVNGITPGPPLVVYTNQNITIHVTNRLTSEAFTMHWHGLEVRGTPWMDGAGYITQCPILPGQTFTYNFMSGTKGTYYYHTHSSGIANMGAIGAFVVKEKKVNEMPEHILIVQDYNNQETNIDTVVGGEIGTIEPDGNFFLGYLHIDGTYTTVAKFTSSLINGRGRIYENDSPITNTPLAIFHVKKGKRYRFRNINAAFALQYTMSIDNHSLDVIATDGHDVVSKTIDKVMFHSGERFDFILDANQKVGNYWIRLETLLIDNQFPAFAILRYDGAENIEPSSLPKSCLESNPCSLLGCATPTFPNHKCIRIEELQTDGSDPAPSTSSGNFKEFYLNFGVAVFPAGIRGVVNGVKYINPTVSAITQPKEINNICTEDDKCGIEKACECIKSINVEFGDIVQLNLINMGFFSIFHHAIHTHGYSFHVIKTGVRLSNENMEDLGNNPDVDCGGVANRADSLCNNASWTDPSWTGGNIPGVDLAHAPRKDTVNVPAGGYAVVRFVADNPGLWFIHCHFELDVNLGMGILLNDSFSHIPPPPPGFPECRNFPPPAWKMAGKNQENISPDNSRKIKNEEDERKGWIEPKVFWGLVGSLLFVVVLQFITMAICMRRKIDPKYYM